LNKKELFYISNQLSLLRFILLILCIYILVSSIEHKFLISAGIIFLIWLSDILDGYFARKRNEITELGKIIDPLADKLTIISIALVLLMQGLIPLWFLIIIALRDLLIFSGGIYIKNKHHIVLASNWAGKAAAFLIGFTLFISVIIAGLKEEKNIISFYHIENVELYYQGLILLCIVMSIISLIFYFKRFASLNTEKANI